jgi:hypothetical protein
MPTPVWDFGTNRRADAYGKAARSYMGRKYVKPNQADFGKKAYMDRFKLFTPDRFNAARRTMPQFTPSRINQERRKRQAGLQI